MSLHNLQAIRVFLILVWTAHELNGIRPLIDNTADVMTVRLETRRVEKFGGDSSNDFSNDISSVFRGLQSNRNKLAVQAAG